MPDMLHVEQIDDATTIVTDPRFGPPAPALSEPSQRTATLMLLLALALILLVPLSQSHRTER